MDVVYSKKLGSAERVKVRKQQREFAEKLEECVQKQVAAIESRAQGAEMAARVAQDTLQELRAQGVMQQRVLEQRFQEAEQRNHDLQVQVEAVEHAFQRTEAEKQTLEGALQELQERMATVEQSARQQVQALQRRLHEANTQLEVLQQRVQEAEHGLEEAERRAEETKQERENPSWVVRRNEILFTGEELGRGSRLGYCQSCKISCHPCGS